MFIYRKKIHKKIKTYNKKTYNKKTYNIKSN